MEPLGSPQAKRSFTGQADKVLEARAAEAMGSVRRTKEKILVFSPVCTAGVPFPIGMELVQKLIIHAPHTTLGHGHICKQSVQLTSSIMKNSKSENRNFPEHLPNDNTSAIYVFHTRRESKKSIECFQSVLKSPFSKD